MPGFEPRAPLGEGEGAHILVAVDQQIVEAHEGRIVAQHLPRDGLAVEALLQVVERRDDAVAHDKQLAVEHGVERLRRRRRSPGKLAEMSSPEREKMRTSPPPGGDLHAHAVPLPFGRDLVADRARPSRLPRSDAPASAGGTPACLRRWGAARGPRARRTDRRRAATARATSPRCRTARGRSSAPAPSWRAAPRRRRAARRRRASTAPSARARRAGRGSRRGSAPRCCAGRARAPRPPRRGAGRGARRADPATAATTVSAVSPT